MQLKVVKSTIIPFTITIHRNKSIPSKTATIIPFTTITIYRYKSIPSKTAILHQMSPVYFNFKFIYLSCQFQTTLIIKAFIIPTTKNKKLHSYDNYKIINHFYVNSLIILKKARSTFILFWPTACPPWFVVITVFANYIYIKEHILITQGTLQQKNMVPFE